MSTPLLQFETERLYIKPITTADAAFLLELLNSPKWLQYIGDRNVKTVEQAEAYITERMLPQQKRLGFSNNVLVRKSDNVKIGCCGLYDRPGLDGIDLGFALMPAYEGKGYGYEAANCLKEKAITVFKIKELKAITTKENIVSQRLLEKLGFTSNGTILFPGDIKEMKLYQLKNNTFINT